MSIIDPSHKHLWFRYSQNPDYVLQKTEQDKSYLKLSAFDYYQQNKPSEYKFHLDIDYGNTTRDGCFENEQEPIINNEKKLTNECCQPKPWTENTCTRKVSDLCLVNITLEPEIANRMLRYVYKNDYTNLRKIEVINGGDRTVYKKKSVDNPEHIRHAKMLFGKMYLGRCIWEESEDGKKNSERDAVEGGVFGSNKNDQ